MSLVGALTTAILPVLSIAAVGYVLGRVRDVEVDALSTVTIYILAPALVFHSLATTEITGSVVAALSAGVVVFVVGMAVLAGVVGRLTGASASTHSALVLASSFPNSGNYGIPLAAFAFGAVGRSTAVLYLAVQSILAYSIGVYIASRGSRSNFGAVTAVFKLPLIYAVFAAGLARWFDVVPPDGSAAMETIRLTGDAAIPVMLVLLGVQLANTTYGAEVRSVFTPTALKLVVAPVVGVGVALLFGLTGPVGRVFVLACAMPAAITPLMLLIEFGERRADGLSGPEYVSTAIFVSTVASVVTLTVLIAILESGLVI